MPFDPARDGWRLDKAIMRLSDPEALARLARACRVAEERDRRPWLPPWWLKDIAPAPAGGEPGGSSLDEPIHKQCGAIEQAFFDQLTGGEVVGWARHHSPVAPYQPVPADAWPILSGCLCSWNWHDGSARVAEIRTREVFLPVLEPAPQRDGQRNPRPRFRGSSGRRLESKTHVLLRLYSVRIQPPDRFRRIGKSASEARCREWLAGLMRAHPDAPRPKAELEEEVRRTFGLGQRAFARAWRGALAEAGPAWSRAGPRKSGR